MRLLIFLLLTTLVCCKNKMEHEELGVFLKNVSSKQLLNARQIFVIPNAGCSGCILNSEQFMISNIDSLDSSYFILTSFQSLKALKAKYSSIRAGILNHEKIIIDTAYQFSSVPIDQKYPLVVFLHKNEIVDVQSLDVDNLELLKRLKID